jgi:hypothetical protein
MNASPVLNIDLVSNPDKIYVAAHYRIEPNTTVIAYHDVAYNSRVRGDETVFAKLRVFLFNRKNDWHDQSKMNEQ